ncbi:transposase [Leptolyngbya sp. 15MV]|nr:transposase [Leptolyngbya sp. 15MV]
MRLPRALVVMSLYTVRSELAMCERITFDMLFRWFLDMTPDEPCFDHSDFSVNRARPGNALREILNLKQDQVLILDLGANEEAARESSTFMGPGMPEAESGMVVV